MPPRIFHVIMLLPGPGGGAGDKKPLNIVIHRDEIKKEEKLEFGAGEKAGVSQHWLEILHTER